jgi:hypothetical protein
MMANILTRFTFTEHTQAYQQYLVRPKIMWTAIKQLYALQTYE